MSSTREEYVFGDKVDFKAIDAIRSFWKESKMHSKPMYKFDTLAKGWDRLAAELFPTQSMGHRFKELTKLCSAMARTQSIDDLFFEVSGPIRSDLETLESDAQVVFDKAKKNFEKHRNHRLDDDILMESIGSLLWVVRSNSMHGHKTPSGPTAPTNRDEQICELCARVLEDLYKCAFPNW